MSISTQEVQSMKLMAAQGNWTRMEEAEHADPITQLSQIRNLDGTEVTTKEMKNRLMDWYSKPDGYERRFTNTDTDPISMESYYPLECFHKTDQLRRLWAYWKDRRTEAS